MRRLTWMVSASRAGSEVLPSSAEARWSASLTTIERRVALMWRSKSTNRRSSCSSWTLNDTASLSRTACEAFRTVIFGIT